MLLGKDFILPPQMPLVHDDVNCQIRKKSAPMTLFAYRTHAHSHGVSINGYLYRNDDITKIIEGNLSQPQIFYPMSKNIEIKDGDFLACQCTYNTIGEDNPISIGFKICLCFMIPYNYRDFSFGEFGNTNHFNFHIFKDLMHLMKCATYI